MEGICVLCDIGVTLHINDLLCSLCQIKILKTLKDADDLKLNIQSLQICQMDESKVRIICNQQISKFLGEKSVSGTKTE